MRGARTGKQRCREDSEMRPGFRAAPSPPPSFPPALTLERFQSPPVAESESLDVFAAFFIVYRTQAKPLKLNRGSAGLYIQTPINTAVSPARRLAPQFRFKARGVGVGMLALRGRGWERRAAWNLRA